MTVPSIVRTALMPLANAGRPAAGLVAGALAQLPALLIMALPWVSYDDIVTVPEILLSVFVPLGGIALVAPLLTGLQRRRFRAAGVDIPRPPRPEKPGGGRLWYAHAERQLRYHLLAGPAVALGGVLVLLGAAVGIVAATVYVWIWALPFNWRIDHPGYSTRAAYVTAGGLVLLYGGAWAAGALVRLDARNGQALLGPSREELLARRVEEVTESRAGVVDAADAERRRIERDLHDGAQQRLVSLAVNLGLAKVTMTDLPEDARRVIDEAHREAKGAIQELSDLVRGLHPAVLEDRGLDAALSGLAERAPLPVHVRVDLASRPAPAIEAVAYFVVSEALANVVKHAQASRADVTVERFGGILLVVVSDDGVGGADAADGTGLAGLAKRVASVDGTFSISSPVGGPTIVTVELPCAP
ncbi:sensor domain-containing protein [Streptomyces sp. AV19]|uniref:sensor histidine kinase n=1 Tax=Streptomyces sp. AV19 TaxID=2793068 RepID=UPI0018FE671F|nr:sensor histidine kinase [Streptomyces sp. AV19]MBH1933306.1 sensor domain-containing protein [Streptomyces sp. AV19]MDG4531916.1 sensor histidine kinase [Streptomyces sp. AV19]